MIHIAVAGALADALPALRRTPTATAVTYYRLADPGVNLARMDLVVGLADDPWVPRTIVAAEAGVPLHPSALAYWPAVPTGPAGLDAAVQQCLYEAFGFVVGYTDAMHRACRWLRMLAHPAGAALRLPVHVTGETGTGKDLFARAVHRVGRFAGRFVAVNLGGVDPNLAASELFGHKRGAFTGADADRAGAVAQAKDGVLFLDEIGDAPPAVQVMLLDFLETGEYRPLGSDYTKPATAAQTQVVTATHADLTHLVRAGRFRADLLQRLAGLTVALPPLRDRRADVPLIARALFRARHPDLTLPDPVAAALAERDWPGNIRQLKMVLDRYAFVRRHADPADPLDWADLDPGPPGEGGGEGAGTLDDLRRGFDRRVLARRLRRFGGDTQATADSLGISRRSVYDLARRLGVDIQQPDPG